MHAVCVFLRAIALACATVWLISYDNVHFVLVVVVQPLCARVVALTPRTQSYCCRYGHLHVVHVCVLICWASWRLVGVAVPGLLLALATATEVSWWVCGHGCRPVAVKLTILVAVACAKRACIAREPN